MRRARVRACRSFPALAKRLREIRSDLPVLYISGYAPEKIMARGARLA